MKVKDVINKYRLSSNADVFVEEVKSGEYCKVASGEHIIRIPTTLMEMNVVGIEIIDNVMTICVRERNR